MTAQRGDSATPPPAAEPPQEWRTPCDCTDAVACRVGTCARPAASAAGAVDEEGLRDVAEALHCVDVDSKNCHWPTVAGVLAYEVRRLRAAVLAVENLAYDLDHVARDYRHAASGSHDAGARNAHMAIAERLRALLRSPATHTTSEEGTDHA